MTNFEATPTIDIPRLPAEPDPEYLQTARVSFGGLAGKALTRHLMEISSDIVNGRTDQAGNDRLVAVVPMWDRATLDRAHKAGFRTAEIDSQLEMIGLELIPAEHRTPRVRVDMNHEIINT